MLIHLYIKSGGYLCRKMKISKFVSRLASKKRKASWSIGVPRGGRTAMITFYAKTDRNIAYIIFIERASKC